MLSEGSIRQCIRAPSYSAADVWWWLQMSGILMAEVAVPGHRQYRLQQQLPAAAAQATAATPACHELLAATCLSHSWMPWPLEPHPYLQLELQTPCCWLQVLQSSC